MNDDNEILEYETEAHEPPEHISPIPVSVCEPVVTVATVPQHTSFRTFVLTTDNPTAQILPLDPLRVAALVSSPDNDVVLSGSRSQAGDKANVSDSTLARPNGGLLPKALTAPVPISSTDAVWVSGPTYPSRVWVVITRRTT